MFPQWLFDVARQKSLPPLPVNWDFKEKTQKDAKSYVIEHIQICITDPDNYIKALEGIDHQQLLTHLLSCYPSGQLIGYADENHSQLGQIYNKFPQILKYPSIYNKFKFNRLGAGNQMSSSQSSKTSIPHEVNSQSFPAVVLGRVGR